MTLTVIITVLSTFPLDGDDDDDVAYNDER